MTHDSATGAAPNSPGAPAVDGDRSSFADRILARFEAAPGRFYAVTATAFSLLTLVMTLLAFRTLPRDTVEGFLWGRAPQMGYAKHPPMQAWILGLSEHLAPGLPQLAYVYAFVTLAVSAWGLWVLGTEMFGARRGAFGALLCLLGMHYFVISTSGFTPDTLSLPFWIVTMVAWWRAVGLGRPRAWWWFGIVVGLSVWAKYTDLLLVAILGVLTLATARGRASLRRPEPWLSVLVAAVIAAPHVHWIVTKGQSAVAHAIDGGTAETLGAWLTMPLIFLQAQLPAVVGLMLVSLLAFVPWGRARSHTFAVERDDPLARLAMLVVTLAPLVITLALIIATGRQFRPARGAAYATLFGFLPLCFFAGPMVIRHVRAVVIVLALSAVLVPVGNAWAHWLQVATGQLDPVLYPARPLAEELNRIWRERTGVPLTIVVGERWEAGNVAFHAPDRPQILLDGSFEEAPWITPQDLKTRGFLAVWPVDAKPGVIAGVDAYLRALGAKPEGRVAAPWPFGGKVQHLDYAVIPPARP